MSIPGSANPLLLKSAASSQYLVERSLRFSSSDSAYLSRTPASAGNRKTWTWAGWVKRSLLGVDQSLFSAYTGSASDEDYTDFRFADDNTLRFGGWYTAWRNTSQVFRDTSAWYHIVLAVDISNATASERVKLYVNGSQVTAFAAANNPATTSQLAINSTSSHNLGANVYYTSTTQKFSGYLADIHFIDGQALTPSSFGQFDANGEWQPKKYSGPTPTGNSFWLSFSDNSAATATTLGKDGFLLGNNWNPVNVSVANGAPASVASASGALPIYNTTDTYGGSLGSGVRSDPNASYLVLAVPMNGSNGGTSFSDQLPSGRTSSLKTFTNTGTTTSTSQSKYYGSSGYFNGSSFLQIPSNSDFYLNGAFTVEVWCYPTLNVSSPVFFVGNWNNNEGTWLGYLSTGTPYWSVNAGGTGTVSSNTALRYNSWNHLAFVSTGTGGRNSIYLNGALAGSAPHGAPINNTSNVVIGAYVDSNYQPGPRTPMTGYLQDLRVYKGIAKYTTDFNPPSATANPTAAAGFDTPVDTPSSAGTDTGLGGQVTGNYCTWNLLDKGSSVTLANGNLDFSQTATLGSCRGTIGVSSGKWYWEVSSPSSGSAIGIMKASANISDYVGGDANGWSYYANNGFKYNSNSGASYGATFGSGDVIGVAFDADAGTLTFYKNGTSQGQAYSGLTSGPYFPAFGNGSTSCSVNFGQRPWAYQAPANHRPLVDTLLPAPVVAKPSTVMDVKLYTGNGSTQTISGLGFSPDFVWIKARGNPNGTPRLHQVFDTVRGADKALSTNRTDAEDPTGGYDNDGSVTAFTSDGFTVEGQPATGWNANAYVAWTWDAGSSTVTNTQGSITSQVRANASAGFSIVTYTGNGTGGATVGHGGLVNLANGMIIVKRRDSAVNWFVGHGSQGWTKVFEGLNTTAAISTTSAAWNNTSPTSTVFTLGTETSMNGNGGTFVAYCFAPVAGYSSFGSYTGNGSADGPFVFCNFRPRWLLIKRTDAANNSWRIYDTARDPYNQAGIELYPNDSSAEYNGFGIDFLSNGFKLRNSSYPNASGGTFLYCAFAESPFAYSRAR